MGFTLSEFIANTPVKLSDKELRQLGSKISIELRKDGEFETMPKRTEKIFLPGGKPKFIKVTEYYETLRPKIEQITIEFLKAIVT